MFFDSFVNELEKIAKEKERRGVPNPLAVAGAGIGGQTAAGLATRASGIMRDENPKDEKLRSAIEARIKREGVGRAEFGSPAYVPDTKSQKMKDALKAHGLKPNTVVGPKGMSVDALAHEAGHATGNKALMRSGAYGVSKLMMLPALAGSAAGVWRATRNKGEMDKEERADAMRQGRAITGASAASQAPMVAEEARATARGARMVKRHGGWKRLPKYLGRTGLAFGTYAASPTAALYATKKMHDKEKELRGSKKVLRKKK